MEIIFLLGGAFLGATVYYAIENRTKIHGIIDVDHNTQQCKVNIISSELSDRRTKTVVFMVNHDAVISRDEQGL